MPPKPMNGPGVAEFDVVTGLYHTLAYGGGASPPLKAKLYVVKYKFQNWVMYCLPPEAQSPDFRSPMHGLYTI